MEGLIQLVKADIRPQEMPEFFWHHLEEDMELLGSATGKSTEESAIIIHLVLKEILLRDPPTCEYYLSLSCVVKYLKITFLSSSTS